MKRKIKQLLLLSLFIIIHNVADAQWVTSGSNVYFNTGNVGIGTTSPIEKLHIEGGRIYLNSGIFVNGSNHSYFHWIGHSLIMGSRPGAYAHNAVDLMPGGASNGPLSAMLRLYSAPQQDSHLLKIQFHTDGNNFINSGNVGIGTATPQFKLHTQTNTTVGFAVQNTITPGVSSGAFIRLYNSGTPSAGGQRLGGLLFSTNPTGTAYRDGAVLLEAYSEAAWTDGTSHPAFMRIMTTPTGSINALERMRITAAGNVGIGTTTPGTYKLAVEGTIGARRVKVTQAAWADFVFHPDYELPSLQEVEQFVKTNHHLPGIPSEKEVKENGLDLGEMDKQLLQKVEELTLYIIQLKKDSEAQLQMINQLQQTIKK